MESTRISCADWSGNLPARHAAITMTEPTVLEFIEFFHPLRALAFHRILLTNRYFFSRIEGVKVSPIRSPSESRKRLTVCPHGSLLFLMSIRYPLDSSSEVALSTLSTSNSSHAWGAGTLSGQVLLPKQDSAACESGHRANSFAP